VAFVGGIDADGACGHCLARGDGLDELGQASSLCAACDDVCPVGIPLHELLLGLRR